MYFVILLRCPKPFSAPFMSYLSPKFQPRLANLSRAANTPLMSKVNVRMKKWICQTSSKTKKTKKGKTFYRLKVYDSENRTGWVRLWGRIPHDMTPYTLWMAEVSNDKGWGASTSGYKVKKINKYYVFHSKVLLQHKQVMFYLV